MKAEPTIYMWWWMGWLVGWLVVLLTRLQGTELVLLKI